MGYQRRNSYRLKDHDYADPSYAYFVTLDTKIKHVTDDKSLNPLDAIHELSHPGTTGQ